MRRFLTCFLFISFYAGQAQISKSDSLLNELTRAKEDTHKVNLLRNIGLSFAHQNPANAILYWKQGATLSRKLSYEMGLIRCYINIGTGYSFLSMNDSAIIYYDSAINPCKKLKDDNRLALLYLNKADAYRNLQNFRNALLFCDTAQIYAQRTGNIDRLGRIYDIISDIYGSQNDYTKSIHYLGKALNLYQQDQNFQMIGQVYSDYADLYKEMGQHTKAISYYKHAIHIADSVRDYKNLSTYFADLSDLFLSQGKYADAEYNALQAVHYAKEQENDLQLATAYNHLSHLYLKQEKFKESIITGKLAYKLATSESNILWRKESSNILSQAYNAIDSFEQAYFYLTETKALSDSMLKQRFNEETAILQNSFEIKEKDKEILLLNKDKELQFSKFRQQKILMFTSIATALLALIGIALLINRYKLRQRMKELELRTQIAADLHDEVGSSLSSINMLSQMASQENAEEKFKKDILIKVSSNANETMERMSDIVWMIKPGEEEGQHLTERMQQFLYDICSSKNIQYDFEADDLDKLRLSMQQRKNIYLIFKEAVNNSVKYAQTKVLHVKVRLRDKVISLQIKDFGKGFDSSNFSRGNGLQNMHNRAKEINGKFEINSTEKEGTEILLSFAV